MHSLRGSLSKRLYTFRLTNKDCARVWKDQYWRDQDGTHVVSCSICPKLVAAESRCSIPFGSPIRKCVSAAQEANLHSLFGKDLLEIGFGRHSIVRRLVKDAGGTWTGIEPTLPESKQATFGKGGFGHVADMPFDDGSFDIVVGIQTLEHWAEPLPNTGLTTDYAAGLTEVHRVLKPGGSIYFDAPIYLHGHEMFIAGDISRIRDLFDPVHWRDITVELWREDYSPLERYPAPEGDRKSWKHSVTSYSPELLEDIRNNRSVSLLTIKAIKG